MSTPSPEGAIPSNKILRTVFLPVSLDRELNALASVNEVSKGELIRRALEAYLPTVKQPPLREVPS